MRETVTLRGGPCDGEEMGISSSVDRFVTVIIPPAFAIYDPPATLEDPKPTEVHQYEVNHITGIALYVGIE